MDINNRKAAIESLPPLRDIIADHDLRAQKSLGQNFLLDLNITDKIVQESAARDCDGWENVTSFEVGPGPGGLTRSLLKSPVKNVTAIEYDIRAVNALQCLKNAAHGDFNIIHGDALRTDLTTLSPAPRIIVANLPYNIATPLLIGWLKQIRKDQNAFQSMTLMFQKEVAERIIAPPNSKAYGRLSVISQWLCRASIIYDLPPNAFTPPPKVKSSIAFFKPRALNKNAPAFEAVEKITAAAFNQRRKMIRSSLKDYMPAIEELGISPERRAETLSVDEYLKIAALSQQEQKI